ncbi:ethanolamine utilization protein EutJ [Amycolatopsis rubida]|uniref:Ethanolamine utilization protein EutJ n=1 Tax=Amycolatopsis rubida TaxID=112413 RepID=A0A1I5VGP9_9PSEU|nr:MULTISPECIES: ethanolamine utilization protein EutJ [Amycolatopsis]MYW89329.1 ethanolamine utilization protein EutJ [Amycolatopsis rubida]NEC54307.1 ethanolamine utilization protein EutJ [Amycolatopsis rubida]OAP21078.1 MreB/Mbl protein [Amycolatopsis sp. M39]SFQ06562.1 ethanolamine utilization protein EutJ [Amycolatopsis rubida]
MPAVANTSGSVVELLRAGARCAARPPAEVSADTLRVGVDLGTASCVLVVLDGDDQPVWVDSYPSGALRDGVVVDFARAAETVRRLKGRAEGVLGTALTSTATAYPPCIPEKDAKACTYVCEAAGFEDAVLVDEVTAAQRTLEVSDGVVVDVGGGSTGTGVFRGGELVALDDRAGGGHHLDLMLAGALAVSVEDAEAYKRENPEKALPILVPGLQRIAESVRAMTAGAEELPLYLAGGALMIAGAGDVLAKYLERPVMTYPHALLITPLGIARSAA